MKAIINGKLYNTGTAKHLATWTNNYYRGDFHYTEESLYITEKGQYFLVGAGEALSKYASKVGNNFGYGEAMELLTEKQARQWAIESLSAEDYIEIFGEVEEG